MWCFIIIHSSVCLSLQVQARSQLHRIIFWYNLQLLYLCQCHCVATSIKSPSHKCKNILSALPYTTSATLLRTGSVASSVVYGRSWRRCIIIIHFEVFIVIYSTTNNLLLFSQLYFGYWLAGLFWAMYAFSYFILLFASVCRSKLNHIYVAAGSLFQYFQYLAEAVLFLYDLNSFVISTPHRSLV